jgi:hypothetical protein
MNEQNTCPTPRKYSYNNKQKAKNALRAIQKSKIGRIKPVRVYLCECGRWHHSSKPDRSVL